MRKLTASGIALLAAGSLGLAACSPSPSSANQSSGANSAGGDQTLTIATTSDVVNYNPLIGNSRTDDWITALMYPRLLTINSDGKKVGQLATKWGYTDPTHGYYVIHSGMKWSDGVPLTAKDVAYTLNAVKKEKPAGVLVGQMANFKSAKAVSKTKVVVTLSQPDSTVIPEVGFWGNIVPEHVFANNGGVAKYANNKNWVSAGPYKLTKVTKGQSYTLTRVTPYPLVKGGKPSPAKVVYRVYPDVNSEILALRKGDVDAIGNALPPAQVKNLKADKGITVQEVPGFGYHNMTYNLSRKPLNKLAVRKALAMSVNYKAILSVALQGQAKSTGSSPISPVLKNYYVPMEQYKFDPQAARKLLTQAGYKQDSSGNFPKLTFSLIYSLQDPIVSQWVTIVQKSAAQSGITIKLEGLQRNTWVAKSNKSDFDIYAGGFAIMDDPTTNMTLTYLPGGAINYGQVNDPKLSSLIKQAQKTTDSSKQITLDQAAAKIVHDKVYDNILYTQKLFVAHRSDWSGFVVEPSELLSIVNPLSIASAKRTN